MNERKDSSALDRAEPEKAKGTFHVDETGRARTYRARLHNPPRLLAQVLNLHATRCHGFDLAGADVPYPVRLPAPFPALAVGKQDSCFGQDVGPGAHRDVVVEVPVELVLRVGGVVLEVVA